MLVFRENFAYVLKQMIPNLILPQEWIEFTAARNFVKNLTKLYKILKHWFWLKRFNKDLSGSLNQWEPPIYTKKRLKINLQSLEPAEVVPAGYYFWQ